MAALAEVEIAGCDAMCAWPCGLRLKRAASVWHERLQKLLPQPALEACLDELGICFACHALQPNGAVCTAVCDVPLLWDGDDDIMHMLEVCRQLASLQLSPH